MQFDLGKLHEGIAVWRRALNNVSEINARWDVFENAAAEIAGFTAKGLDVPAAADALAELAIDASLVDSDRVQEITARAIENVEHVKDDGNGKGKGNGHDKHAVTIMSVADFIAGFTPPSYLVDGILQRGFIYALTGPTSHAKSAIALLLAELVARSEKNTMFGRHRVKKGRVLYFVGENPTDIQMRIIGAHSLRFDDDPLLDQLFLIKGRIEIEKHFAEISAGIERLGGVDLVIIDTSAAYFLGEEELSNTQMGNHARMLRALTSLPGGPCVLVLCHPIKHASEPAQLLPRGGGAFLAEMDGNLTAWKNDDIVELSWTKLRGPGFEPMMFKLETVNSTRLVDNEGNALPTVRAVVIGQTEEDIRAGDVRADHNQVLLQTTTVPHQSLAKLAELLGWTNTKGEPQKMRVKRALDRLIKAKCIIETLDGYEPTEQGKKRAGEASRQMTAQLVAESQKELL